MNFDILSTNILNIQKVLQQQTAHAINSALTARNWLIGCYIVEYEQHGDDRATYGESLLQKLEQRLNTKGLTVRRFREFRRLYLVYPQLQQSVFRYLNPYESIRRTLTAELESYSQVFNNKDVPIRRTSAELEVPSEKLFRNIPCSHLMLISNIDDPLKRVFYEIETIKGCWSVRELERQISSLYYERSGLSKNKEALSAMVNNTAMRLTPADVVNSPFTLEFLGLNENAVVTETVLETAILDNLQKFLLELGQGFCFEARQKRILIDDDYFKADLIFYHRILKCHIIVELKVDRFRHEYASQLNTYLNYYKNEVMLPDDNPPIGLLLCAEHGDTIVKYACAGLDKNIFVRKYKICLPSEEEIENYIKRNVNNTNL